MCVLGLGMECVRGAWWKGEGRCSFFGNPQSGVDSMGGVIERPVLLYLYYVIFIEFDLFSFG